LSELSIDEITEVGIYDSLSISERKELLSKKQRRVFINTPITLRIFLKNPLHISIGLKNIKVVCKEGMNYNQNSPSVVLEPFKSREVLLKITPLEEGDFEI
jgi:nucleotidyltransferase/DNA polymerase involved in DNA repair